MLEVVFHSSAILYYLYADAAIIKGFLNTHALRGRGTNDESTNRIVNGSLTYITIWNLVVHQIYFAMCCQDHLKASDKFQSCRTRILRAVLFPTTCVVTIIYWWYYWKSPSLIFGDILAEVYPWWVDHVMHTFILPIALFELYLSPSKKKEDKGSILRGMLIFIAFISFYMAVVTIAHRIRGVWPYPFLDTVNNGNCVMFFMYLYAVGTIFYFVGIHISDKVWGHHHKSND